jgi:regulator of protease activity HflC (stomatin/prohibitin superfamily)
MHKIRVEITGEETIRRVIGPIHVVKQFERGIVEFFGKYIRFVGPGLHIQIPNGH